MAISVKEELLEKWRYICKTYDKPAWYTRAAFIDWCVMSGYEPGMTLSRKDTTLPHSPENCYWVPEDIGLERSVSAEDLDAIKSWNHTVNRIRKAAGLPLFPE